LASFRVHRLATRQVICDDCLEWHLHALQFLGGAPPRGCQGCRRDWQSLQDETPGDQVRLYVVAKDGMYQLLCAACVKPYLPKTKELYKGTRFGKETLKIQ
jgi:hypothetical protein